MDKQTKVVICTAAAYMLLSMVAMIIVESRKRKRAVRREGITYGPMDESTALGTEEDGEPEGGNANGVSVGPSSPCEEGATSKGSKTKKVKIVENEEEGLIGAFKGVYDKLAMAITQVAKSENELPKNLFETVNSLSVSGFNDLHISMYYAHLVANPLVAKAFYELPFKHKLNWIVMFVSEKFPGQQ